MSNPTPKKPALKPRLKSFLDHRFYEANKWGKGIQKTPDGDRPWEERTIRDVANLDFLRMAAARERAAKAAENTTQMLGVVMLVPQMQSADEWEAFARDEGAIETEAKLGLPEKSVPCASGEVGSLPEQLGESVPVQAGPEPTTEREANGQKRQRRRRQKRLLTPKKTSSGGGS